MKVDERFYDSVCGYLKIIATPLQLALAGGEFVQTAAEVEVTNTTRKAPEHDPVFYCIWSSYAFIWK